MARHPKLWRTVDQSREEWKYLREDAAVVEAPDGPDYRQVLALWRERGQREPALFFILAHADLE